MGVNEPTTSRPSGRIRVRPEDFCVEEVGAFEPRIRILEDYLDRPVRYNLDPTSKLIESGEKFTKLVKVKLSIDKL